MTNRVFVFADSRSGSNWLVETLNNHPEIGLLKEIFQWGKKENFYRGRKKEECIFKSGKDVQYVEQHLKNLSKPWRGCKILFAQIRIFDFYEFINFYQNAYFIILQRLNAVRAELSGCIAKCHGRRHEYERPGRLLSVYIDPRCFYRRLEWRRISKEFIENMLSAYQVKRLNLTYEGIFKDRETSLGKIWKFLNVEPRRIKYSNEKPANHHPLRKIVKNYEQFYHFFQSFPCYHNMIISDNQNPCLLSAKKNEAT
jgi:hypothetical protein